MQCRPPERPARRWTSVEGAHAPGGRLTNPPAALQTTTTITDASKQNNTGPLGGPVKIRSRQYQSNVTKMKWPTERKSDHRSVTLQLRHSEWPLQNHLISAVNNTTSIVTDSDVYSNGQVIRNYSKSEFVRRHCTGRMPLHSTDDTTPSTHQIVDRHSRAAENYSGLSATEYHCR